MARKPSRNGAQSHPSGPLDTVDDEWKKALRIEMRRLEWDQKDLAGKIPCSPASITNMFKPGDRQIRFKARVEELVGWISSAKHKQVLSRVERAWPKMSLEDAHTIASLAESLASKR